MALCYNAGIVVSVGIFYRQTNTVAQGVDSGYQRLVGFNVEAFCRNVPSQMKDMLQLWTQQRQTKTLGV